MEVIDFGSDTEMDHMPIDASSSTIALQHPSQIQSVSNGT